MVLLLTLALLGCGAGPKATPGVDADGDGYVVDDDCNDDDADVHPGAVERCDGEDQDCDGEVDELAGDLWFVDADGDGFGDPWATVAACDAPDDVVAEAGDCDDGDPASYPGAPDGCDGVDNDCDGELDEDDQLTWYADADGDGYGDALAALTACEVPMGYVDNADDCDDTTDAVAPGADELCNKADDDCDGEVDEDAVDGLLIYPDTDGDGYGSATVDGKESCVLTPGTTEDNTDCDDRDPNQHPGADELCNDADDDCDTQIDEDPVDALRWYLDTDEDGYGAPGTGALQCDPHPSRVDNNEDCDDTDPLINPEGVEVCGDGIDQDCDEVDPVCAW